MLAAGWLLLLFLMAAADVCLWLMLLLLPRLLLLLLLLLLKLAGCWLRVLLMLDDGCCNCWMATGWLLLMLLAG